LQAGQARTLVPSYASLSPESNGPGGHYHFPPAADPLAGALLLALLGAEHDEGAGKDRGDPLHDVFGLVDGIAMYSDPSAAAGPSAERRLPERCEARPRHGNRDDRRVETL
jgi:hypothetical protein